MLSASDLSSPTWGPSAQGGPDAVTTALYHPPKMKHSASLFFNIMAEQDSTQVLFDLAAAAGTPRGLRTHRSTGSTSGSEENGDFLTAAMAAAQRRASVLQPEAGLGGAAVEPRSVLEDLLGDLYIDASRLEVLGLLGQGGIAAVHRCNMTQVGGEGPNMLVAVKKLRHPEALGGDARELREFMSEANLLRKLRHPLIVSFKGMGAADLSSTAAMRRSLYVVMESLEGGTLHAMVVRQMMSPSPYYAKSDALRWCIQIASAMQYLHQTCRPLVMHRNLQLSSVLLTEGSVSSGTAKLADFGLHQRAERRPDKDGLEEEAKGGTACRPLHPDGTPARHPWELSFYGGTSYDPSRHGGALMFHQATDDDALDSLPSHHHPKLPAAPPLLPWHSLFTVGLLQLPNGIHSTSTTPESSSHPLTPSAPTGGTTCAASQLLMGAAIGGGGGGGGGGGTHRPAAAARRSIDLNGFPMTDASHHGPSRPHAAALTSLSPAGIHLHVTSTPRPPAVDNGWLSGSPTRPSTTPVRQGNGQAWSPPFSPVHRGISLPLSSPGGAGSAGSSPASFFERTLVHPTTSTSTSPAQKPDARFPRAPSMSIPASGLGRPPHVAAGGTAGRAGTSPPGDLLLSNPLFASLSDCAADVFDGAAARPSPRGQEPVARPHAQAKKTGVGTGGRFVAAGGLEKTLVQQEALSSRAPFERRQSLRTAAGGVEAGWLAQGDARGAVGEGVEASGGVRRTTGARGSTDGGDGGGRKSKMAGILAQATTAAQGSVAAAAVAAAAAGAAAPLRHGSGGSGAILMGSAQQVASLMYQAPELLLGEPYSEKIDVFSFGVLMCELFLGKLLAVVMGLPPPSSAEFYITARSAGLSQQLPSWWPPALRALLTSCWARDPAARPAFPAILKQLTGMVRGGLLHSMEGTGPHCSCRCM